MRPLKRPHHDLPSTDGPPARGGGLVTG